MDNTRLGYYSSVASPSWVRSDHLLQSLAITMGVSFKSVGEDFYTENGVNKRELFYRISGEAEKCREYLGKSDEILLRANRIYDMALKESVGNVKGIN